MKTAVRLGPIAHLRRAKFEVLHTETRHENERGQAPSHSHTWLPYITPNGVRLAHEILIILSNIMQKKLQILNTLPNGVRMVHETLMILSKIVRKKKFVCKGY